MQQCDICFCDFALDELKRHKEKCIQEQLELLNYIENDNINKKSIIPLELTEKQICALKISKKKAKIFSKNVKPNLFQKIISLGYSEKDFHDTINFVKNHVPIIVHINLDITLDYLLKDDHLRNRFETNISGGSIDMSSRLSWEDNLFKSVYKDAEPFERVKYGAVNINCSPIGIPRAYVYGNSYLILNEDVKLRSTFVYDDSSYMDLHIATFNDFCNILYYIPQNGLISIIDVATGKNVDNKIIDYPYIECQIHGPIRLDRDIDMIVVNDVYLNNNTIIDKFGVSWTFMNISKK